MGRQYQRVDRNGLWQLNYSILFYPITLGGRRGTTDEFAAIPFHLDLFSAALVELAKSELAAQLGQLKIGLCGAPTTFQGYGIE